MTGSEAHGDGHSGVTDNDAPRRGSPVARAALLAYLLLIVYASWYPFTGWRNNGLPLLSFMNLVKQRYWTGFDVMVNIVGYVPLGILLALALYPLVRGVWATLLATLFGFLVTGTMETVQNFLPSRVPSNLDLLTNAAGCFIGACIGPFMAKSLLDQGRLYRIRKRWFAPHASQGLVLLALWPLAQIYPQSFLFGHGQVLPIISGWLSAWLEEDIDLIAMLRPGPAMSVEQFWLSETIITACGMTGAALTLLCLLRRGAPRYTLMLLMLAGALVIKTLASSLLFRPDNAFVWVTPGAEGGFLIGLIEALTAGYVSSQYKDAAAFVVILLVPKLRTSL